jgi:hypothetical protein
LRAIHLGFRLRLNIAFNHSAKATTRILIHPTPQISFHRIGEYGRGTIDGDQK